MKQLNPSLYNFNDGRIPGTHVGSKKKSIKESNKYMECWLDLEPRGRKHSCTWILGHFLTKNKWVTFLSNGKPLIPNKDMASCQSCVHIPEQSVVLLVISSNKKKLVPLCFLVQSTLKYLFNWGVYAFYGLSRVAFQSQIAFLYL